MGFWQIVKRPIKISVPYILKSFLLLCLGAPLLSAAGSDVDWKTDPSNENWKAFFKASDGERAAQWAALTKQGLTFEALAWQWKLAWVRSCTFSNAQDCSHIIQNGLFDKALVVRAEAASRIGQRFADTGHAPAIRLLRTAYAIQQNSRSNEPMFVQYRILQALNDIGGEGRVVGKQLAMNSASLHKYWTRIASAN